MFIVITVLIMLAAVLLAFVVLVQNGKGGGLAANFASQNQVMGVRKTTDFLEKTTWVLAVVMIVLCILSSALVPSRQIRQDSTNSGLNINTNLPASTQNNNTATPQGK
ncbi:MAG: preprotein translocase subunit SecG [Bacteroidales bacterium]|nr:preprotein translocase subunit SecG [Bacteroidales bacterium]